MTLALKVIKDKFIDEAFKDIKVTQNFHHKGIVKHYESGEYPAHIISEYCSKGTLQKMIDEAKDGNTPIDENTIQQCITQIVKALDYIHKKGIYYRGLRAKDILIDENGNFKISDIGQVKV